MKAVNDNGTVRIFASIPNEWKNHLNFSQADEELLREEGFYDLIEPIYDPDTHRLGDLYFDKKKKIFTYTLVEIPVKEIIDRLYSEVDSTKQEIRMDFLEVIVESLIDVHKDDLPPAIVSLYYGSKMKFNKLENDIKGLSPDNLRKYKVRDNEMEDLASKIKDLKKSKR